MLLHWVHAVVQSLLLLVCARPRIGDAVLSQFLQLVVAAAQVKSLGMAALAAMLLPVQNNKS
jgi:hypothetical protein